MQIREALTFDDVLLVPAQSSVLPSEVDTRTNVTKDITFMEKSTLLYHAQNSKLKIPKISNDFNYNQVFSWQLEGLSKKNDLLFAISTSGKSKNILSFAIFEKNVGFWTCSNEIFIFCNRNFICKSEIFNKTLSISV